jgi:hypothetical protein
MGVQNELQDIGQGIGEVIRADTLQTLPGPHLDTRGHLQVIALVIVCREALEFAPLANLPWRPELGFGLAVTASATAISARSTSRAFGLQNPLFGVHSCAEVAQRPEEAEHLLLVVLRRTSALLYRLWTEPLMIVNARSLSVENVNIEAAHCAASKVTIHKELYSTESQIIRSVLK